MINMLDPSYKEKMAVSKLIAGDIVNHLTDDMSEYDKHYRKRQHRKAGRYAIIHAREASQYEVQFSDKLHTFDVSDQLFPDVVRQEQIDDMKAFATHVGDVYIGLLFHGSIRKWRPYGKENFPYPDGHKRVARDYMEFVWAPRYAEEFVLAHELGLTKETVSELQLTPGGIK